MSIATNPPSAPLPRKDRVRHQAPKVCGRKGEPADSNFDKAAKAGKRTGGVKPS